jgi:hypothetical protein
MRIIDIYDTAASACWDPLRELATVFIVIVLLTVSRVLRLARNDGDIACLLSLSCFFSLFSFVHVYAMYARRSL